MATTQNHCSQKQVEGIEAGGEAPKPKFVARPAGLLASEVAN